MRLSLFHKFSISILSICILGMALVWLSTRLLFEASFLEYINKQNEQRMLQAVERLASHYSQTSSWQQLEYDNRIWRQLASGIREDFQPDFRRPPRPYDAPNDRSFDRPNRPRDFREGDGRRLPLPPTPGDGTDNKLPIDLTLLNTADRYIAGHSRLAENLNIIRLPIKSDGEVVGYLLGRKQTQISEAIDQNFADSLNRSVLTALGLGVFFTLVIATLLARNLSRPVKDLSSAAHQLSQGNYDTRMPTDRSDELGLLAEDFNLLAKTLDANRHSQQRWIADISHELRTPLAILKGELMAIEDGVRQFDDASLTSLINEIERFSRMVNDLYDLSRADAGDLDYRMESVDLIELLEDATSHFQQRFAEKGIELSLAIEEQSIFTEVDFDRITQLLSNLLENSLRYTDSGGQTKIQCIKQADYAVISIEDSLPGVPSSSLEKIFERLYRVEISRSRQHGGGGLGLALCKSIAEAHQGRISAEKSTLGGLKINVLLPLQKS